MEASLDRVIRCVEEVFRNKGASPPVLGPSTPLTQELGLDSLDYAELVARLEYAFGFDPFASGVPREIRTLTDLASLYERPNVAP